MKPNHSENSGAFITFEGGEGSGKTSLIDRLYQELEARGLPLLRSREPGGSPLGERIRNIVLDSPNEEICKRAELLLFMADRAHHVDTKLRPAYERGEIVLCDRYIDSSFAYQGPFFDREELERVMDFATGGFTPHLTFYLDLDPKLGFQRARAAGGGLDRIESFDPSYHENVRKAFLELSERFKDRIVVIDADQSREEVFDAVWSYLAKWLKLSK